MDFGVAWRPDTVCHWIRWRYRCAVVLREGKESWRVRGWIELNRVGSTCMVSNSKYSLKIFASLKLIEGGFENSQLRNRYPLQHQLAPQMTFPREILSLIPPASRATCNAVCGLPHVAISSSSRGIASLCNIAWKMASSWSNIIQIEFHFAIHAIRVEPEQPAHRRIIYDIQFFLSMSMHHHSRSRFLFHSFFIQQGRESYTWKQDEAKSHKLQLGERAGDENAMIFHFSSRLFSLPCNF